MIAILNKGVLSTSLCAVQIRYDQVRQDATSISASNLDMTERQKAVSTQKCKHTLSAHFKQLLKFLLLLLLLLLQEAKIIITFFSRKLAVILSNRCLHPLFEIRNAPVSFAYAVVYLLLEIYALIKAIDDHRK